VSFNNVEDSLNVFNGYSKRTNYLDSISNNFITSAFKNNAIEEKELDSLIQEKKKSLNVKSLFYLDEGIINTSYSYGLLVGYIDTSSSRPLQSFKTNGDFNINVATVPVRFTFNYNTLKNPFGVNNYFRASIDMEKYKEKQRLQKQKLQQISDKKIGESENIEKALIGKLGYAEIIKQRLKDEIDAQKETLAFDQYKLSAAASLLKDSAESKIPNIEKSEYIVDSSKVDSLRNELKNREEELEKLLSLYNKLDSCYNQLQGLKKVQDSIQSIYSTQKANYSSMASNGMNTVGSKFLSHITKLDFGLTYPKSTALSSNSIPIKGVDFEYQNDQWYTSVSAGIMMNNLMVTNDLVQSKLLYSQNMFNLFDFQNIKQKRFMTMIKSGYGTKDNTHLFLGIRYTNRAVTLNDLQEDSSNVVPSLGLELDFRLKSKYLKGTVLDFVYGKTSNTELQNDSTYLKPLSSLFSTYRTHVGLIKVTQSIHKLKSTLSGSLRWIDPYADMASIGVLQPNNVRAEFTTKHTLTNNFTFGVNFRKDRNNVDNHLDSTLNLMLIGGTLTGRVLNQIDVFGNLNYLTQTVTRNTSTSEMNSENYMYSFGGSTSYKIGELMNSISLAYNDYLITTLTDKGRYKNISFQNLSKLTNGQNSFSINYFKVSSTDSLPEQTIIIGDELSFNGEKTQLKLGLKLSYSKEFGDDYGFKFELNRAIYSNLNFSVKVEKFILGNFYSSFDLDRFNRFPYLFMTQLNYKFK
jgi:hypothetical protein